MTDKPEITTHVFICERCTYKKDGQEIQSSEDVKHFRKNLKEKASQLWDKKQVRINASGCLGQCEKGISCVIYPKGEWLLNLVPGDEEKVLHQIKELEK